MSDATSAFLEATVRTATPLALAALGETLVQRAGVVNIGLEGIILVGAFAAALGVDATGGAAGGYLAAATAGVTLAGIFAFFVVARRTDQIITGTAITLLALGLTAALHATVHADQSLGSTSDRALPLGVLAEIPIIGRALFAQPVVTYATYAMVPLTWLWLRATHAGLALRAVGERPDAARAAGVNPAAVRIGAILFGGALGGLAGGALVAAQAGTFAEGMSAGRGFMAIAIVVLGRWSVAGTALAALFFGAAGALQYLFQSLGLGVPYQLPLALPYMIALVLLAAAGRRGRAPAALGRDG